MKTVAIATAKEQFDELVEAVEAGESITITRQGKPVAQLVGMESKRKPLDIAALKAFTDSMPMQEEDAGTFMRRLRDDARY